MTLYQLSRSQTFLCSVCPHPQNYHHVPSRRPPNPPGQRGIPGACRACGEAPGQWGRLHSQPHSLRHRGVPRHPGGGSHLQRAPHSVLQQHGVRGGRELGLRLPRIPEERPVLRPGGRRPPQSGGPAEGAGGDSEESDLLQHLQLRTRGDLEQSKPIVIYGLAETGQWK